MNLKKRYWTFILYPESAPLNFKEVLQQTFLPIVISPLHDKDLNSDNSPKKAHYHIILCYDGPTTYNNVLNLTKSLNATIPQPVENIKGCYRYLIHADENHKYHYDENDLIFLNGFDISNYINFTFQEENSIIKILISLIYDNNILSFSSFVKFIMSNDNYIQYFQFVIKNSYFFNCFINSLNKDFLDK